MALRQRKSTPSGAPSTNYRDSTTPEVRSHAKVLFDKIGIGKSHAVKRPKNSTVDRAFRELIERANRDGDCIINLGEGYYRPGKDDEDDLRHYLYAELHRAQQLHNKIDSMREAYYGRY